MKKIGNLLGKWLDGLSEKQSIRVGLVGGLLVVLIYLLFDVL